MKRIFILEIALPLPAALDLALTESLKVQAEHTKGVKAGYSNMYQDEAHKSARDWSFLLGPNY